jgi:hypothetical protein
MSSGRRLSGPEFGALFSSFRQTAFRLETLAAYDVVDDREQLGQFRAGRPLPPPSPPDEEWRVLVRGAVASGKDMSRVHVLPPSLTPYLRYEIDWGYLYNAEAGERILLLEHDPPGAFLPGWTAHDFWLFDDATAVRMHYDSNGTYQYPEMISGRRDVEFYAHVRDVAVASAVTLQEYLVEVRNS